MVEWDVWKEEEAREGGLLVAKSLEAGGALLVKAGWRGKKEAPDEPWRR